MGLFYCPMGAVNYQEAGCIDCGLCYAKTRKEAVAASKKIREYLKTHASARQKGFAIHKIAVCGKGGVGKSTIAALIARILDEYGYDVTVLDADESNPRLNRKLGIMEEPKPLISVMARFSLGETNRETEWLQKDTITLDEIPAVYTSQKDRMRFMMVGKIEDPLQGCACSMATITRDFVLNLELKEKEIVIVDQEAGVESFGRGVERGVDTVLIIVEPSYESIALAETIKYMAEGIGIRRVRAILNKIPSFEVGEKMIELLAEKDIRYLEKVYLNSQVSTASFEGRPVGPSEAWDRVAEITRLMLDEAEMKYNKT